MLRLELARNGSMELRCVFFAVGKGRTLGHTERSSNLLTLLICPDPFDLPLTCGRGEASTYVNGLAEEGIRGVATDRG